MSGKHWGDLMVKRIEGLVKIKDKEKVIETLISSFAENPKLINIFPGRERRAIAASAAMRFYGIYSMKQGGAYSLSADCNSIVTVLDSGRRKATKIGYFLRGSYSKKYRRLMEELTEEERKHMKSLFDEVEEMEADIEFPKKYLYVSFLGVRPQFQNQGQGRKTMECLIAQGEKNKLPLVLFTSEPNNVAFYQELGFKIIGITSSKQFRFINIYLMKM